MNRRNGSSLDRFGGLSAKLFPHDDGIIGDQDRYVRRVRRNVDVARGKDPALDRVARVVPPSAADATVQQTSASNIHNSGRRSSLGLITRSGDEAPSESGCIGTTCPGPTNPSDPA